MNSAKIAGLYAIADTRYLDEARLVARVRDAIAGGARVIQYRDKSADTARRARQAGALATLCRETETIFLVNDDVALAHDVGANGVHLGRDDAAFDNARAQLGAQTIVGVSCYNELPLALAAQAQGASYVAFGSFFPSNTKPHAVRATATLLREARVQLRIPIVAIGGITPQNGAELIDAGADALAVIEGLFGRDDTRAAATDYARLFEYRVR